MRWWRPKLYRYGPDESGITLASPFPDAVTVVPAGAPPPICVRCNLDCCDRAGYTTGDEGIVCMPCELPHERWVPSPWDRLLVAIHNAKYRWAMRYGRF